MHIKLYKLIPLVLFFPVHQLYIFQRLISSRDYRAERFACRITENIAGGRVADPIFFIRSDPEPVLNMKFEPEKFKIFS